MPAVKCERAGEADPHPARARSSQRAPERFNRPMARAQQRIAAHDREIESSVFAHFGGVRQFGLRRAVAFFLGRLGRLGRWNRLSVFIAAARMGTDQPLRI